MNALVVDVNRESEYLGTVSPWERWWWGVTQRQKTRNKKFICLVCISPLEAMQVVPPNPWMEFYLERVTWLNTIFNKVLLCTSETTSRSLLDDMVCVFSFQKERYKRKPPSPMAMVGAPNRNHPGSDLGSVVSTLCDLLSFGSNPSSVKQTY